MMMNEKKRELWRAVVHVLISLSLIALVELGMTPFELFLILIVAIITSMIYKRVKIPVISIFLENLERPDVLKTFPGRGLVFLLTGMLLAYKLFPHDIAMTSMITLGLLDPISKIFGMSFGRTLNILDPKHKKYLEGHLVGGTTTFLASLAFVNPIEAFIAAVVGAVSESVIVDLNGQALDDNIVIPLSVGSALVVARIFGL